MTDAKRTGSRDISELKQRLGLKKGAASQTGSTPRMNGGTGGVVPPPGLNLPPPPGVTPAQPPQPVIPDAKEDPFGAMNAIAAVGTAQRAPEIVIVNDGRPVESVGAGGSLGVKIAMIAVPGVIALLLGMVLGRSSHGASDYNAGVDGASVVLDNVKGVKGALNDIQSNILSQVPPTAEKQKAKVGARIPFDDKMSDKLNKVSSKLEVKANQYAVVRYITNDSETAAQVLELYAGVQELRTMITIHVNAATSDDQAFKAAADAEKKAKLSAEDNPALAGQLRYAILLTTGQGPAAKFVELGPLLCGTNPAGKDGKCPDGTDGSPSYRVDSSTGWTKVSTVESFDKAVPDKILPLIPSQPLQAFVQGPAVSASQANYAERVQAIADKADDLLKRANKVEPNLQKIIAGGTKFTFFM